MEPQHTSEFAPAPEKKKSLNISVPAAIITGAAIIAIAIFLAVSPKGNLTVPQQKNATTQPTEVPANVATIRPTDYVRGSASADVVVIEYSDSDCPYCKQFHETMQQTLATYNGKVSWVYRFFPLEIHPNAYSEALALTCVGELGGNEAFWPYLDTIMNVTLNPDPKSNEALTTFATQAGIDANLFKACLQKQSGTARIDADTKEAKEIGAKGTPFSVAVNTKTGKQAILPGAVPLDYMKQVVDALLK